MKPYSNMLETVDTVIFDWTKELPSNSGRETTYKKYFVCNCLFQRGSKFIKKPDSMFILLEHLLQSFFNVSKSVLMSSLGTFSLNLLALLFPENLSRVFLKVFW